MKQNILGPVIKEFRKNRKLTQKDLGRLTGFSQNTISNHENGNRSIDEADIFRYAEALNVSPNAFFQVLIGKANKPQTNTESNSSIETIYNQLDQKRQQKVYSFAEQQLKEQNKIIDYPIKYDVNIYGKMTAGYGSINFDKDHPIKTITLDYAPPSYDIAFEVSGDSMHPTFQDGEVIFVKETKNIHDGMLAAVEINDEAFIKKLYIEENRVRLVSLNCEKDKNGNRLYPDFYADEKDNIHMIGRVLT